MWTGLSHLKKVTKGYMLTAALTKTILLKAHCLIVSKKHIALVYDIKIAPFLRDNKGLTNNVYSSKLLVLVDFSWQLELFPPHSNAFI